MAIVNRDVDPSQKKETISCNIKTMSTGVTHAVWCAPFNAEISFCQIAAQGLSGTPVGVLEILKFVAGAGLTSVTGLGNTITITALGTSGSIGMSLAAAGSTLLQVAPGDTVVFRSGGTNAAVAEMNITLVVKALQDIKSHFGIST